MCEIVLKKEVSGFLMIYCINVLNDEEIFESTFGDTMISSTVK
jgi:hypothetical protein